MASFWAGKPASPENLRLWLPGEGWKAYSDRTQGEGQPLILGSKRQIESLLLNALNSTNLVFLSGLGASLSANNGDEGPTPPRMNDLWNDVRSSVGEDEFQFICSQFPDVHLGDNIEKLLTVCKIYAEIHEWAADDTTVRVAAFVATAESAILKRVDFVSSETNLDAHEVFVRKVGRRGLRKPRARFFTTNYDLCFEEVARRQRFTVIDGFSHSLNQTYDRSLFEYDIVRRTAEGVAPDYIENVFQLYKMHGSVDWRRVANDIVRTNQKVGQPVLIYPRSSKYQEAFEAPYLDMIAAFQAALREPDTAILICGFGFNDDHISRPIMAAIEGNLSLRVVMIDPIFIGDHAKLAANELPINADDASGNQFIKKLRRLCAIGDARIHLINGRFSDAALALPDLMGETDRERHSNRMRSVHLDGGS